VFQKSSHYTSIIILEEGRLKHKSQISMINNKQAYNIVYIFILFFHVFLQVYFILLSSASAFSSADILYKQYIGKQRAMMTIIFWCFILLGSGFSLVGILAPKTTMTNWFSFYPIFAGIMTRVLANIYQILFFLPFLTCFLAKLPTASAATLETRHVKRENIFGWFLFKTSLTFRHEWTE